MEMEQPQQKSNSMVFVLVVSAVFLAVATFIAILLLGARPTSPETAVTGQGDQVAAIDQQITINDTLITLNPDPNKTFFLVNEISQAPAPESDPVVVSDPTDPPVLVQEPTVTPAPPAAPTRDPNPVIFISYTVMQGDSLYSIADSQNSSIELMALHGIDDNNLTPGTVLERLPIANPAYCPGSRAYVVRDLDTVFRIAHEFGITVEAIAQLNALDPTYNIEVTEVLCIPIW